MQLHNLHGYDFSNKRVLIRTDFNVAIGDNYEIKDDFKVRAARETIHHVLTFPHVKIALASHLGRPDGQVDSDLSFSHLKKSLAKILDVEIDMVCDCVGVCVENALSQEKDDTSVKEDTLPRVLLLENLRFHGGEKANDREFSRNLAAPFDVYINDAFAVCHRAHASVHGVTHFLESFAGLWLQKEVEMLSKIHSSVESPAVAIIGGAKIATKLPLISKFDENYDHILVGGKTAVEALDEGMTFSQKVLMPQDFAKDRQDIGPETIEKFVHCISEANTIVWNGPLGRFETPPFDKGTRAIAEAIGINKEAFSVVGGGESVQALVATGEFEHVSFVSTGGGAMLAFLSGEDMPALEVLC